MKIIYKYTILKDGEYHKIKVLFGGTIIHCDFQKSEGVLPNFCFWICGNKNLPIEEEIELKLYATGEEIPEGEMHLGSAEYVAFNQVFNHYEYIVYHLFQKINPNLNVID